MKLNEIVPLPHMEQSETHVTYYAMREKRHTNPTQSATTERKNGRNVNSITSATSAMLEEESESNNQGARVLKLPFKGFRSRDFQSSNAFQGARVIKLPFQRSRSHTKNFFSNPNPSIPSSSLRGRLIFSHPHQILQIL